MFVDSHCHLNFDDFDQSVDAALKAALTENIMGFLCVACELKDFYPILKLSIEYPQIHASVGIHPHESSATLAIMDLQNLKTHLKTVSEHHRVVALGETGLDFYYEHSNRSDQEASFRLHLDLSVQTGLPVIVHTRDAEADTMRILHDYKNRVRGVIHCFSGSQWLCEAALELGFMISFSGIVTFPKAQALRDIARGVPMERLLLETDAPYLAPVPKRGKRNEPAFMIHTAKVMAELKDVDINVLAEQTTCNFYTLFAKAKPSS